MPSDYLAKVSGVFRLSVKAFSEYKFQMLILVGLSLVGGLLEGIGITAVIPLLSLVVESAQTEQNAIMVVIQNLFAFFNLSFSIKSLLVFIGILFFVKALIMILLEYIKIIITTNYETKTRLSLFQEILRSDWLHLIKQKLGYLDTILLIDIPSSAILLREIGTAIMISTSLLVYIVIALNISFGVTMVTIGLGGLIFVTMRPLLFQVKRYSHKVTNINKEVAHHVNENIFGIKSIKATNVTDKVINEGKILFDKLKRGRINIVIFKSLTSSFIQPISIVFVSIVFVAMYKSPDFNFAVLVAVMYLIDRIFIYIQKMERSLNTITEHVPYLKSVVDYQENSQLNQEIDAGQADFKFEHQIKFDNINFGYQKNQEVLRGLNLVVSKGQTVGLIGPSGSGKTTIIDLTLKLINPESGRILLDDTDIKDIKMSQWRDNIGYVSQDIFLINDTIANNIKFYRPDISREKLEQAAKMANIHDFIIGSPDGYQTFVGDRGVMLSAGQRQRIVIARVLATNPQILILDEATSALDSESEMRIQDVIESLHQKITVIIIAHRLSTIKNVDQLFVLAEGKIVESGPPEELLKNKDTYFYKMSNISKE
ncbi:MAG: ABC transporter ATP-binding protein [Patescibacteria group bacterium]|jgi:ABC-type multidrug transport system fused ATPase/permease subunit|nr:ABC transporter ATP-binding protein [Patescibacteria group bacterium]